MASEVRLSQLPIVIVYAYKALLPYIASGGRDWLTPPPTASE